MADIVVTDTGGGAAAVLHGCKLDVEFGDSGKNDFQLSVDVGSGQRVALGSAVYIEGTEYGGIVDASESDSEDAMIRYTGRTWHGILAGKVVMPPSGAARRHASGDANACLLDLIELAGLSGVMTAPADPAGIGVDYDYPRFCDGYTGARGMLASAGARLAVSYDSVLGMAVLSAVAAKTWQAGPDSNSATVKVRRVRRCVNHLVSLGEGTGTSRIIRHDYADAAGNVSQVQTLFGIDEIAQTYDYTNADAERLAESAPQRLRDLQDRGSLKAQLSDGEGYAIGDTVTGIDVATGDEITVPVGTVIAVATDDYVTVEYRAADETSPEEPE